MIRAILWKEYREQRIVWLTLATLGAGLYGLPLLLEPRGVPPEGPLSVAMLLTWAYGLVCGSMLLAGEREAATMAFLDMMPIPRLQLWLMKCGIGLLFLLGQVVVIFIFLIGLGIFRDKWQAGEILLLPLLSGIIGMSWGLLFSARGENVLNAIGLAIACQIVAYFAAGFLAFVAVILWQIVSFWITDQEPRPAGTAINVLLVLVYVALTLGALIGSARIFSRPDRLRGLAALSTRPPTKASAWTSWIALLWLTYTQMRRLILGLIIFSLGLGFVLPTAGSVAWPILTLFIGVLCGVTVCDDEQAHGSFRFLGDRRFPLGRVWIIKLGMRFALAVFAAFLLMLPSLLVTIFRQLESQFPAKRQTPFFSEVLHSSLVGSVVPTGLFLSMWLLYGFSVGQLSALLFRKSVVAIVVSLGGAVMLVSLWLPALLGMGLHFWQIAGVPLVLLLTAWTLVPAWVANRLRTRGTFARLGAAFVVVGLLIAFGLWYRLVEVPDLPDQLDMAGFAASIPSPEENKAGQLIRSACTIVETRERSLLPPRPNIANAPAELFSIQAAEVLERGWPKDKPGLGAWLDAMLQDNWTAELAQVPDLPLGVVEDPRRLTISSLLPKVQASRLLINVLAARGLQRQAAGDDEVFADNLRIGLAVSRNLQHDAPFAVASAGQDAEKALLSANDRWLEKLRGQPELLKRVLRILQRHEAELPDERQPLQAEYLVVLNTLEETPAHLAEWSIVRNGMGVTLRGIDSQAVTLAWLFPWEYERHRRILRVIFQSDPRQRRKVGDWGFEEWSFDLGSHYLSSRKRELARLRASQLEVALRLYQVETGKSAATLDALVPRYLSAIPRDPFDGQPFRYRLSKGENLQWELPVNAAGGPPPAPTRFVPKGQGILWSVGPDDRDDGGVRQSTRSSPEHVGEDLLYLVPLPAK